MSKHRPKLVILFIVAALVLAWVWLSPQDKEQPAIQQPVADTDNNAASDAKENIMTNAETEGTASVDTQSTPQLEPPIREALKELVNTSNEGLTESIDDNGVSVDLQGRHRTAPVATVNENGEIVIQDYTSEPADE